MAGRPQGGVYRVVSEMRLWWLLERSVPKRAAMSVWITLIMAVLATCRFCPLKSADEESSQHRSMASQSQSTCWELRSLVRSSSNWRCGSWRLQKECSCKACACSKAARQPGNDGGLPVAEDLLSDGRVQPFGECRQHYCDLLRGRFQTVQGGMASGTESGAAGLTTKRLDALSMAMLTISNQGVNVRVCDVRVGALAVRTGETLRVHPLGCASAAFHLTPGADRRRRRPHSRRVGAGEATGGAIVWRAWRCRRRWSGVRLVAAADWAGP